MPLDTGCIGFQLTSTFSTTCLPNEQTLVEHWIVMSAVLSNLCSNKDSYNRNTASNQWPENWKLAWWKKTFPSW